MNFRQGKRPEDPEINLIPFIDVLLVIIIFLMITTTYTKMTALKINLPTADAEKSATQPVEIHVEVDAQGQYAIDSHRVEGKDVSALVQALTAAAHNKKEPIVIIDADAMSTHQTVVNVLEAAQQVGLSRVTFAAKTGAK